MTSWLAALVTWCSTLLGTGDADAACLELGRLDARRAVAFLSGDPERLRDVYATPTLREADASVLRGWSDRGLRLEGMAQQRTSCHVVARSSRQVELDVVDRLGPTRAVGPQQAYRLPSDQPTRRRVVLTWTADGWRIGAAR
ncbi:hypothetical protein [Aeromicrobium sp. CnD17-E]|jgi:hypothetical protein|uniref:hypothetical protein n=1 Tax=Aeromicrobium sp. CnD17-E TaxID=2954487 RepID=UPI0020982689|nr:hypothetical protein [Aeromicrobium sp. CnD17-E]MCO7239916.1 hypothetical protein [Aeromicrobium sp. CnD17-E]